MKNIDDIHKIGFKLRHTLIFFWQKKKKSIKKKHLINFFHFFKPVFCSNTGFKSFSCKKIVFWCS